MLKGWWVVGSIISLLIIRWVRQNTRTARAHHRLDDSYNPIAHSLERILDPGGYPPLDTRPSRVKSLLLRG